MESELQHWLEWRIKCDLSKCTEATRTALRQFVYSRFKTLATSPAIHAELRMPYNVEPQLPKAEGCWHEFEVGFLMDHIEWGAHKNAAGGKKRTVSLPGSRASAGMVLSAKNYLMVKALTGGENSLSHRLESIAFLRLREVVRRWLKGTFQQGVHDSLDDCSTVDPESGPGPTIGDCVASLDSADEMSAGQYFEDAGHVLKQLEPTAQERQVAALQYFELKFTQAEAREFTGLRHTRLYEIKVKWEARVLEFVEKNHADEEPWQRRTLLVFVHRLLQRFAADQYGDRLKPILQKASGNPANRRREKN